ncbi:MAG: sugar phosphate isomerase/epimerase [Propioniciclava sp.]|uniref:sugar phosphate isomerase/epimerase family protein n=1 Tax=Propioniciclava sp. TaxID=2038686 RepID=UPI0039E44383
MRQCIATVSLGGSLVEKIDAIASAGFGSVELFTDDFLNSGLSAREVALRCRDAGLRIEAYQPFRRAEGVTDDEFTEVVARFRKDLAIIAELGTDATVVVSNTDPDAIADRDHSAAQLATLAAIAAEHGVGMMFEALSWGTHIKRTADAWDVLQRAGLSRGSLVLDTFHLLALGDGLADLAPIPVEGFGMVQVADAPLLELDVLQWSRNHRCFPGEGEFDLVKITESVLASGFDGLVSLEIFNPRYREQDPRPLAQRGADSLNLLLQQATSTAHAGR